MSPAERRYFLEAQRRIGCPYIWAGKGETAVRDGKVVPMAQLGCVQGFDCSGFITCTAKALGALAAPGWWNAQAMNQYLPEPMPHEMLRLVLYGDHGHADHVALELGALIDGRIVWTGYVLEAAGGDSRTVDAAAAAARPYLAGGARVGIWLETHHNRLAVRSLERLMSAPQIPPQ